MVFEVNSNKFSEKLNLKTPIHELLSNEQLSNELISMFILSKRHFIDL